MLPLYYAAHSPNYQFIFWPGFAGSITIIPRQGQFPANGQVRRKFETVATKEEEEVEGFSDDDVKAAEEDDDVSAVPDVISIVDVDVTRPRHEDVVSVEQDKR